MPSHMMVGLRSGHLVGPYGDFQLILLCIPAVALKVTGASKSTAVLVLLFDISDCKGVNFSFLCLVKSLLVHLLATF